MRSPLSQPDVRLYFENSVGRVLEHPDGYAIFQYYAGPRELADLQALLTHTSRLMERHDWNRLLGDQRTMAPFTDEESSWIVEQWLDPARQRSGGIRGAVLITAAAYAQLPEELAQGTTQAAALSYRYFTDEGEAVAWLLTQ